MPDTNGQRDPVNEARAILDKDTPAPWRRISAELLKTLCGEVDRLRRLTSQGEKSDVFSDEYAALGHDERDSDA